MQIEKIIESLIQRQEPAFPFEREFAVVRFCGMINWPQEETASDALAALLLLHILKNKKFSISRENSFELLAQLNASALLKRVHDDMVIIEAPMYYDVDPKEKFLNNTEYVADIVRFLLTFGVSNSPDLSLRPSLGKAHEFINILNGFPGDKRVKRRSMQWGDTTHQSIWKKYKVTAPFQFVRYYDSQVTWLIDPTNPKFLQLVIDTASKRSEISDFFSKSLWVQNKLKSTLDRRSLQPSEYARFPDSIQPIACKLPEKPPKFEIKMKNYQRNRAGYNFEE